MNQFFKKYKLQIIVAIAGAVAGYFYWRFIGCQTGSCPLKSVWYYNVLLGGLIGYVLADTFQDFQNKRKNAASKHENNN